MVRPDLEELEKVKYQKKKWSNRDTDIYILFVPRMTRLCNEFIAEENITSEDRVS